MNFKKALVYLLGLFAGAVIAVVGLGAIIPSVTLGIGAMTGLILFAAGMKLLGDDRLADWLEDLFDR